MAEPKGVFITLEGGEGAGKSVQLEALADRVEAHGRQAVRTREPGGTALGERLREILLDPDSELDATAETLLVVAARSELVAAVIAPALGRGGIVLCDRFGDSTTAYQGYGRGVARDVIDELNRIATGGIAPDLTVLLDLPVADGLARAVADAPDRFEAEELPFHERVRAGYLDLAKREPKRWLVVDAMQPAAAVTGAIWQRIEPLLTR